MSKKDFDMSQLVSGLTGEQEEKNENRTQTVKRKKPMEHVGTLVSVEQMAKVRTIAEREGIALKDIFAVGLKNVTITMPASAVLFNTKMKHKDIEQALYNLRGRTFEYKDNERYTVCGFINLNPGNDALYRLLVSYQQINCSLLFGT